MNTLAQLTAARLVYKYAKDEKPKADKGESKDKAKKKQPIDATLGPLQHAYVADWAGGVANERAAKCILELKKNDPNPGWYDRLQYLGAEINKPLSERIQAGAARLAENPKLRLLSQFDPTRNDSQEGLVGLIAGLTANNPEEQATTAKRYVTKLRKYQDPVSDQAGNVTARETPWHVGMQGLLANLDSDIAGHRYARKNMPKHYWLNPFAKTGPLSELSDRIARRHYAGVARPDSTKGRVAANVIPLLGVLLGTEEGKQKLRRLAYKNQLYAPEAMPEVEELAKASAHLAFTPLNA